MNETVSSETAETRTTSVLMIITACVAVEVLLSGADLGFWATIRFRSLAYENAAFWTGLIGNWPSNYVAQPYLMFVSYAFLHAGVTHLIINMYTLYYLGPLIVDRIGQARFVLLYVLSILGGASGFAFLSDSIFPMVGASGALFGLVGAIAAWEYVDRFTAKRRLWPILRLLAMLLAINVVMWWAMKGQLAWETHLGGFVAGWIFAFLIDPRARPVETDEA